MKIVYDTNDKTRVPSHHRYAVELLCFGTWECTSDNGHRLLSSAINTANMWAVGGYRSRVIDTKKED